MYMVFPDEVTRDYTYGEANALVKKCRLLPWTPAVLEELSDETLEPTDLYYEVCKSLIILL